MTPKERVALEIKIMEAFNNARILEKEIYKYKEAPLKYEREHPDFDIDETLRLYQEFMDAFDQTFTQLQEDIANGRN